jgi:hypothetical protein
MSGVNDYQAKRAQNHLRVYRLTLIDSSRIDSSVCRRRMSSVAMLGNDYKQRHSRSGSGTLRGQRRFAGDFGADATEAAMS